MTDIHDLSTHLNDLSAELNLRALRGDLWLSPRELTGLLRGTLRAPAAAPCSPELQELLSLAPLAREAQRPPSLQALNLLISRLEDTGRMGDWLDFSVMPEQLSPRFWSAAGRLLVCAAAISWLARHEDPDPEPLKLMARLTHQAAQLTPPLARSIFQRLNIAERTSVIRLVWPQFHTDALTYAGPGSPDEPSTPRARRWQQALYPTDQVHLLNVTLYAQRPAQAETHRWPEQPARTGSELAALMKGLTALQGDLSDLSDPGGEPGRQPDFTQVQRLILPAISPHDPDGSLMVSTLLVLAALPWMGTWLTAAMSRAMPDPDDELGGLKHVLNLLLTEMDGHPWAGRLAAVSDLWPQLRKQLR